METLEHYFHNESDLSVNNVVRRLGTYSDGKTVFADDSILNSATFSDVSRFVSRHTTIYDYSVLRFFIEIINCSDAREQLRDFVKNFENSLMQAMNLMKDYELYTSDDYKNSTLSSDRKQPLVVEYEGDFLSCADQNLIKRVVCEKFRLLKVSMVLKFVSLGCIALIYAISDAVRTYLLKYKMTVGNLSSLAQYQISRLIIGDKELKVPLQHTIINEDAVVSWTKIQEMTFSSCHLVAVSCLEETLDLVDGQELQDIVLSEPSNSEVVIESSSVDIRLSSGSVEETDNNTVLPCSEVEMESSFVDNLGFVLVAEPVEDTEAIGLPYSETSSFTSPLKGMSTFYPLLLTEPVVPSDSEAMMESLSEAVLESLSEAVMESSSVDVRLSSVSIEETESVADIEAIGSPYSETSLFANPLKEMSTLYPLLLTEPDSETVMQPSSVSIRLSLVSIEETEPVEDTEAIGSPYSETSSFTSPLKRMSTFYPLLLTEPVVPADTEVMIEASSTDILLSSVSLEETDYETVAIRLPCPEVVMESPYSEARSATSETLA
ncbi:fap1 adhesin-like isoform X1 [Dysidea avara]|uniref:fap1 adhesin-like isoform X1 n=2 Tax=Dysidea avara TaxID=196820 RepID=UPI0033192C00